MEGSAVSTVAGGRTARPLPGCWAQHSTPQAEPPLTGKNHHLLLDLGIPPEGQAPPKGSHSQLQKAHPPKPDRSAQQQIVCFQISHSTTLWVQEPSEGTKELRSQPSETSYKNQGQGESGGTLTSENNEPKSNV